MKFFILADNDTDNTDTDNTDTDRHVWHFFQKIFFMSQILITLKGNF